MTSLPGRPTAVHHLRILLRVEDVANVLDSLRVDEVVSLALLTSLAALAGHIAGPVAGLEVVTVDQTTWIRSGH